ncbi:MAG: hypothetical protein U0821_06995 [Chloroflexota bacterium]
MGRAVCASWWRRYGHAINGPPNGSWTILDEFCAATGYPGCMPGHCSVGGPCPAPTGARRGGRPPLYGPEDRLLLELCWELTDGVCSKRLAPFLGTLVAKLARLGALPEELTPPCRRAWRG